MIRIAIAGAGKIARVEHLPALTADAGFTLVGTADPRGGLADVPACPDLNALLDAMPGIDAVAICAPPQQRFSLARQALLAGKHVLLEKPPGATLAEVEILRALAARAGRTLQASWHSRHAPGVVPAAAWLAGRSIASVAIVWKEDVRHWHPGQEWIWQPGGFGVFDPGINALSIATAILPRFLLRSADLSFPANKDAPIAALLHGALDDGAALVAEFDFRQTGTQTWDIRIEASDGGSLLLSNGGHHLSIDGVPVTLPIAREYTAIYRAFAALIAAGASDVDVRPLALVADAFMLARRIVVDPFEDA